MKFWQKIVLFSILTFVLIFNAASIMVIERNHSQMLEQEINNTLSESMSIRSSVNAVLPILKIYDSIDYEKTVLTNIATEFVEKSSDRHTYVVITQGKRVIYSNTDFTMPKDRDELDKLAADEIHYVLRDVGERTLLYTSNINPVNNKKYEFTYIKDVTRLYEERLDQYRFFFKIDIGACVLYALLMFIISKGLTKPIDRMIRTAQDIAEGNFSERVKLKSKDEIGMLATNFNVMAEVVEDKINKLELNNHEKERFIQNITHELKTPLTSIIGYANYLRVTKYNEETFLDGLNVIYTEGKRLESLSFKLMDLILLKQDHFEMEIINPKELIEEMEPSIWLKAEQKGLQMIITCVDGFVQMDQELIKILLYNLTDNAIKASAEQGCVTIRSLIEDGHYIVEVTDQGIGISEEHLGSLFEPFYMVDKSRTTSYQGVGLGLAICHSIAVVHGARIEVRSVLNQGTTMRVIFDAQIQHNEVIE